MTGHLAGPGPGQGEPLIRCHRAEPGFKGGDELVRAVPARAAVMFALGLRRKPYVFGATGTRTGTSTGESTPRRGGPAHGPRQRRFARSPGHPGIFIGEEFAILAPRTGDVLRVVTYESFITKGNLGVAPRRLTAPCSDGAPPPP
jgi:hypothetical protein